MKKLLLVIAVLITWQKVLANESTSTADVRFDNFYTVSEGASASSEEDPIRGIIDPVQTVQNMLADAPGWVTELKAKALSLLQFDHHNENYGDVNEAYNRLKHFGTWINDKSDDTCYNTRAKVLIRDSKTKVTFNSKGCTVVSGTWDEPYTNKEVTQASDIQIDHFVPLKNAYISGAYKWDYPKRCLYANFMGNPFHLISADSSQNMRKGDRTPEGYMPPAKNYACQYLEQWLKVKLIWDLGLTPPEKDAVVSLIQDNKCDLKQFNYAAKDLQDQRKFIDDHMDLCQ